MLGPFFFFFFYKLALVLWLWRTICKGYLLHLYCTDMRWSNEDMYTTDHRREADDYVLPGGPLVR